MGELYVLWTPSIPRPWWRTDERCDLASNERVWTDCCGCKVPADETDTRLVESWDVPFGYLGGEFVWGGDWEDQYPPTGAFYEPRWETRCAEGFGCTVNPRKKCGRELREMWRYPL